MAKKEIKAKKQDIKVISPEEKIKAAARKLFTQKGFAATKTRDIAEEAGMNLAMLNYYFRSKEKLFDMIMLENLQAFIKSVMMIVNDKNTSLEEKIEVIVGGYIDMLIRQPDLPLFILTELRSNPHKLVEKMGARDVISKSYLIKQYNGAVLAGKIKPIHPVQFIANLMGLTVFPFVASPILMNLGGFTSVEYREIIEERKKLIPEWLRSMMKQ